MADELKCPSPATSNASDSSWSDRQSQRRSEMIRISSLSSHLSQGSIDAGNMLITHEREEGGALWELFINTSGSPQAGSPQLAPHPWCTSVSDPDAPWWLRALGAVAQRFCSGCAEDETERSVRDAVETAQAMAMASSVQACLDDLGPQFPDVRPPMRGANAPSRHPPAKSIPTEPLVVASGAGEVRTYLVDKRHSLEGWEPTAPPAAAEQCPTGPGKGCGWDDEVSPASVVSKCVGGDWWSSVTYGMGNASSV